MSFPKVTYFSYIIPHLHSENLRRNIFLDETSPITLISNISMCLTLMQKVYKTVIREVLTCNAMSAWLLEYGTLHISVHNVNCYLSCKRERSNYFLRSFHICTTQVKAHVVMFDWAWWGGLRFFMVRYSTYRN